MTDDPLTVKIATDENDLAACGCGANDLEWGAPDDHNAREADHSLAEAEEIGGTFVWETWDETNYNPNLSELDSLEEKIEEHKEKAERNGVRAYCAECYGSMSPTMVTDELRDTLERRP
jgi:hypothetical protein